LKSQFCVFRNPAADSRDVLPYLLDVQSDLLDELATTVVVPLRPESALTGARLATLMPAFDVEGRRHVLITPQLAGISRKHLGVKVCNLSAHRSEILSALDFLITGI
jgi:toxin CcdB